MPNSRSTPAELFYDVVEDLLDRYEHDRKKVKLIFRDSSYTFLPTSTLEEFEKIIKNSPDVHLIESSNIPFLYEDVHRLISLHSFYNAQFKENSQKEAKKEKQRAIKDLEDALDTAFIRKTSTLESVLKRVRIKVDSLPLSEIEVEQIFQVPYLPFISIPFLHR